MTQSSENQSGKPTSNESTKDASQPSQDQDWTKGFKERFQTIGSASLAWHPLLVQAFPSQGKLVVHTRDWSLQEKLPRATVTQTIKRICEAAGMHLAAHREAGPLTENDRRNHTTRFWHVCYVSARGCVVARGATRHSTEVDATTFDVGLIDELSSALREIDLPYHEEEKPGLDYLAAGATGIMLVHQASLAHALERSNYDEKTLAFYDKIVNELPGGTKGRLAIITGCPGGGKTHIIKGLLADLAPTSRVIYIPPALIPLVGRPELMPVLIAHHQQHKKPLVLILEDADEVLMPRGADNMSGISTLLNITDGVQSDQADVRVIATSNAKREKMDKAIGRKGRFFGHLDVGKRKPAHARAIFERVHPGKEYPFKANQELHLGEIYAGELDEDTDDRRPTGFN